jgi:hypothetical protein
MTTTTTKKTKQMGLNQTKKLLHNKEINAIKRQPTD